MPKGKTGLLRPMVTLVEYARHSATIVVNIQLSVTNNIYDRNSYENSTTMRALLVKKKVIFIWTEREGWTKDSFNDYYEETKPAKQPKIIRKCYSCCSSSIQYTIEQTALR